MGNNYDNNVLIVLRFFNLLKNFPCVGKSLIGSSVYNYYTLFRDYAIRRDIEPETLELLCNSIIKANLPDKIKKVNSLVIEKICNLLGDRISEECLSLSKKGINIGLYDLAYTVVLRSYGDVYELVEVDKIMEKEGLKRELEYILFALYNMFD